MKKIKLINLYLILNLLGIVAFVLLNRISHGYYFEQVFYNLTGDAVYDFFVFLNQTSTSTEAFTAGPNPPLVRLVFRFIFRSLPISTQELYETTNLRPDATRDLRVNAFAFLCFWEMFCIPILFIAKMCEQNLKCNNFQKNLFILLSLFSTGIVWSIERGNIVIWAMACTMYFCFNYESDDKIKREISYLLLGIAISMKIYPALFGILLLRKKDWKAIIKTIFYVIVFTVLPLILAGGFQSVVGYVGALFNQVSSSSNLRAGYLNGLSVMLTISRAFGIENLYLDNILIFRIFNYVFCLLISFAAVYLLDREWLKIITLVFAMYLLPGITHTYMLSFIIIPLIMFFNEESDFTIRNGIACLGFLLLTTIIPIGNGKFVESLRDQMVVDVANRLSGIMLVHILGELILTGIIFYSIIKNVKIRIQKK